MSEELEQQDTTITVTSLDQFVQLIAMWHDKAVRATEHMLSIPEGTEVEYEGKDYKIEGDFRAGYICGLTAGLNNLGTLPFQAYVDNEQPN